MEQIHENKNPKHYSRSFHKERLARINADPYDSTHRTSNRDSTSASNRLINFVKTKLNVAISGVKKFIDTSMETSRRSNSLSNSLRLPPFPNDKLGEISSTIQNIVSKPEYQKYYSKANHGDGSQTKPNFLNVVNFYKNVTAEKLKEKIMESDSLVIPEPVNCQIKPSPVYVNQNVPKKVVTRKKEYSRQSSLMKDSNPDGVNMNGKRKNPSILSAKEKEYKEKKKVNFRPELCRVNYYSNNPILTFSKSSSSIIKYSSSEEEDAGIETEKKIFREDKVERKDPLLKISLAPVKQRVRANPFIKKQLVERASTFDISTLMKNKGASYRGGEKPNIENSFDFINDSKIETDSDEANLVQNSLDSPNINVTKGKKNKVEKEESLSESSEKGVNKFNEAFPKKLKEPIKQDSPSKDFEEIEEKEAENEDSFAEEQQKEEEKEQEKIVIPSPKVESPKEAKEPEKPLMPLLFKQPSSQQESKPKEEKPQSTSLFSSFKSQQDNTGDQKEQKPSLFAPTSTSLFGGLFNTNKESKPPVAESTPLAQPETKPASLFTEPAKPSEESKTVLEPTPVTEKTLETHPAQPEEVKEAVKETQPKISSTSNEANNEKNKEEVLPVPTQKPAFSITEEALKNPVFAGLNFTKSESVKTSNPFLSITPQKSINFTDLLSNNNFSQPNPNPVPLVDAQLKKTESVFSNLADSTKPKGILELVQPSQNTNTQSSGLFSNTLKPAASNLSWLSNNDNQDVKQPNLFGSFSTSSLASQPTQTAQPQNNILGSLFSGNNNTSNQMEMSFGNNNNSMQSGGNFLFNNNNSGGGLGFGNNMGTGSSLFGGNTGSSSLFGGNTSNQMGDTGMGLGRSNSFLQLGQQQSNPFLPDPSLTSTNSGILGGGGFGGYSIESGKKKKNQKDRAF